MSICEDNHEYDPIVFILQLCADANFQETAHMLEKESGRFFNLEYFEDLILSGKWEEAEKYLSGFTGVKDNIYSMKIYFDIRKQKYYEALYNNKHAVALDILRKDLKVFEKSHKELYTKLTLLLTIENFREQTEVPFGGDSITERKKLANNLRRLIEDNSDIKGIAKFPPIDRTLLNTLNNFCDQDFKSPYHGNIDN